MGLNVEQIEAKKQIQEFIKNKTGFFGLLGAGGTGKTYLITSLKSAEEYQFLAPTNKAVNVLRNGLKRNGMIIPKVSTVDSFFSLRMKKDEQNKTIYTYKQPNFDRIPDVIIVDECSMLSMNHIELLSNMIKKIPIILLGDDMQLPPVQEGSDFIDVDGFKKSKSFSVISQSYTLKLQNRQSQESGLFKLINGFRNHMSERMDAKQIATQKNNKLDVLFMHQNSLELEDFISKNECVAITFKNNTCDYFNYKIGSVISKNKRYNIYDFNEGDNVVFNSFYLKDEVCFYTSELVKIIKIFYEDVSVDIPEINVTVTGNQKKAIVKNELGIDKIIWMQNSELRDIVYRRIYRRKKTITDSKILAKLNTFYNDFKNGFADLKKPYALTSHKSQGSTYKNVIIPVYDFYKKEYKDANQLLYVAMSRASEKIVFVDGFCNFTNKDKRVQFTEEERCLIASIQNWKCNICSIELNDAKYEIDHIKRLGYVNEKNEKEGTNTLSNLQAICKTCHKEKTQKEQKKKILFSIDITKGKKLFLSHHEQRK